MGNFLKAFTVLEVGTCCVLVVRVVCCLSFCPFTTTLAVQSSPTTVALAGPAVSSCVTRTILHIGFERLCISPVATIVLALQRGSVKRVAQVLHLRSLSTSLAAWTAVPCSSTNQAYRPRLGLGFTCKCRSASSLTLSCLVFVDIHFAAWALSGAREDEKGAMNPSRRHIFSSKCYPLAEMHYHFDPRARCSLSLDSDIVYKTNW